MGKGAEAIKTWTLTPNDSLSQDAVAELSMKIVTLLNKAHVH